MDGFTDIRATSWVRHLPPILVPYAILARFDRPIGAWLLFLPGLWSICLAAPSLKTGLWLTILFFLGAITMRGAGCVVNDLWDRKLDAQVTRTASRPLASGQLQPISALIFLAILLAVSLVILLQLNNIAILLGMLSLVPVALYPLAKRVTWWPQIVLGVTFGWGAPEGFCAATGHFGLPAISLYLAALVWILGYDTIYAHQDREDDALIGVKSTARLLGDNTKTLLTICYLTTIILVAVSMALAHEHALTDALLIIPGVMLRQQVTRLDIQNPALCLKLFKANREVGLAIAAVLLAGRI
jgi:4-hydroxybenzoate polyprenyltransferase